MTLVLTFIVLIPTLSFAEREIEVAVVNGVSIKKSTLLQYHEQNLKVVRANKKITLQDSLNDLIDRIIGIQAGKNEKVDKKPEVVKKMNDIIYHAYISEKIAPLLKKIKVNESDIKKYYEDNKEYRTSQILLRLRAVPSAEEVAEAQEKSMKIYNELQKNPKSFPDYAKQYGQTSTAVAGGDIGYQPRARLSPEYFENINGKKEGYITKPFRTQFGIHIVMVSGVKEYKQIDQKLYEKILYDQKRDEILANYFEKSRKNAKIEINKKQLNIQ